MIAVLLAIPHGDEAALRRAKYAVDQIFHAMRVEYRYVLGLDQMRGSEALVFYGNPLSANLSQARRVVCIPDHKYLHQVTGSRRNTLPSPSGSTVYAGRTVPIYYDWMELDTTSSVASYSCGAAAVGRQDNRITFGFDLLMSAFHLLSCQEEYMIDQRDRLGRFRGVQPSVQVGCARTASS